MNFTLEGTTKRYKGNQSSEFKNSIEATYQYGCEFEFYLDDKYRFKEAIQEIRKSLYKITDADILEDLSSLPNSADKDHCIQIKGDASLGSNGIEITIPITSKDGFAHYVHQICYLIGQYGYTNQETGLHIHISTVNSNGINFNFYKYMLLCDDEKLLSKWQTREGYSHNVMDILAQNTKLEAKKIKTGKGTIWNLEKISFNHIEIKSIGGVDYHSDTEKLIDEFNQYADLFHEALQKDTEKHKDLYRRHKKQLENVDLEKQNLFMFALEDAGILVRQKISERQEIETKLNKENGKQKDNNRHPSSSPKPFKKPWEC